MQATTTATLSGQDVPASTGSGAQYAPGGVATSPGVTTPPTTTGDALEGAIAGMVQDVRRRSNDDQAPPIPGMPNNTETVIIRETGGGGGPFLIVGTLVCVAAAGVTLWQAHHAHKSKAGK